MKSIQHFIFCFLLIVAMNNSQNAKAANGVMTTVFCLANTGVSAMNARKLILKEPGKKLSLVGLLSGGFQAAYGAFMIQEYNFNYSPLNPKDDGKTLGQVNIAVGTVTALVSVLNLTLNKSKPKEKKTEVSFNTYPIQGNQVYTLMYRRKL